MISVVIVNYNGADHLPVCLQSLRRQTLKPLEILLVDNASTDSSRQILLNFPEVEVIQNSSNEGFSKAVNRAAELARAGVLGVLNTDVELDRRFLEEGLRTLEKTGAAAVAAKILFYDRRAVINGVGGGMNYLGYGWDRGLNEIDHGQYDETEEVFFASGGACFLKRDLFLKLGCFDDYFFMYHEDVDYCWRARLHGHQIVTAPRAVAYHKYGAITRRELGWSRREILGERHNLRSLLKNYEMSNAIRAWIRIALIPLPFRRKLAQIQNFFVNLAWLPDTLARRRQIQKSRRISDQQVRQFIWQSNALPVRPAVEDQGSPASAELG
ncbi:MAG TPA: glycosyltransferase family 2 protein [Acidobacteriota bacterium]